MDSYRVFAAVLLPLVLGGCAYWPDQKCGDAGNCNGGSGSGGTTPDGVVNQLTPDELGQLCDQFAARVGGYGGRTCPDGSVAMMTSGSRDNCVTNSELNNASCTATVATWEACASILAAADPCTSGAIGAAQTSPACTSYYGGGVCVNIN